MRQETSSRDFHRVPKDEFAEFKMDELEAYHVGASNKLTEIVERAGRVSACVVILSGFSGILMTALNSNAGFILAALVLMPILCVLSSSADFLATRDSNGRRYAEQMSMDAYVKATDGQITIYGTPYHTIIRHSHLSGYYDTEDSLLHAAWISMILSMMCLGLCAFWVWATL